MPELDRLTPDGFAQISGMMRGETRAAMGVTLGFDLVEVDRGRVVFEGNPDRSVYNPLGAVHGGYAATLLDSACGCAVQTMLDAGFAHTTLELKISYQRALSDNSGPVRAEGQAIKVGRRAAFAEAQLTDKDGRLCATASSTLLVFPIPPANPTPS